ncbi:GMC oxidoreductase [Paracoccus tibetensis]|uniref:Choline dehydrogenase n=1 Tax=Paracoccus tibetensis TaxID=336292 RepID=A0A1G5H5K8_9RHOB|nr:GMC oxidoreductase [Paracoccus tibetensis]SCY59155.1 Choline dehydrogenase [Paracoccus tibetensis]
MTIVNLDAGTSDLRDFDVLIVGSGPAGLAIATELMPSGLQVAVLESGGDERQEEADALNEHVSIGHRRAAHGDVGCRVFGGSSALWTGRCGTLDDMDFHARPWVPLSGWPVRPADLAPFYQRAGAFLGIAPTRPAEQGSIDLRQSFDHVPVDEGLFKPVLWQFSRSPEDHAPVVQDFTPEGQGPKDLLQHTGGSTPVHVGRRCRAALQSSENVHIFTSATVAEVNADPVTGAVTGAAVLTQDGTQLTFTARRVVLACGGIQNARLLLASRSTNPAGLGNKHDQVGRYLCDHTFTPVATFVGDAGINIRRRLGSRWHPQFGTTRGHVLGLRLSEEMQRHHEVLNASIHLVEYGSTPNPLSSVAKAARQFRSGERREALRDFWQGISKPLGLSQAAYDRMLVKRPPLNRPSHSVIGCVSEQELIPESRVTLSSKRDRFGRPLAQIDWRISEREFATVKVVEEAFRTEAQRLGEARYDRPDWVNGSFEGWKQDLIDLAHPSCTTRMSNDPAHGVVDATCQVHGVAGLYVAGSSVFASNGHMNPTQTLVALAMRLADHIRDDLTPRVAAQPLDRAHADSRRVRFGFIGGGHRVETVYAPVMQALSDVAEVCGVATRSKEGADRITSRTGWSAGTNTEEMIARARPEVLIVATPPGTNDSMYPGLLTFGIPLLLETPFCWNENSGRKILREIDTRRLMVSVAEQFPFMPEAQLMRRIIALGLIGHVEAVENDFAIYDYHGIALARTLMGRHRRAIHTQGNWHRIGRTSERWLSGTVTCEDGGLLLHRFSSEGDAILHRPPSKFCVYGSKGTLLPGAARFDCGRRKPMTSPVQREVEDGDLTRAWIDTPDGIVDWVNPFFGHRLDDQQIAVGQLVSAMADVVRFAGVPPYPPRAALEDVELVNAMQYSADRGGPALSLPSSRMKQKVIIKAQQKFRSRSERKHFT